MTSDCNFPNDNTWQMRIAIIGTGALACLFGARLSRYADVFMLGSWRRGIESINDSGIRIEDACNVEKYPVQAYFKSATIPNADCVLILVKSWQTIAAGSAAIEIIDDEGLVITLQNGLGNFEQLVRRLGVGRVVAGVTTQGAELLGPGHIRYAGGGNTYLGNNTYQEVHLENLIKVFNLAGFPIVITDNLQGLVWGKLAVSAGINAITALMHVRNGKLLSNPESEQLMIAAAHETADVAVAKGINIPYDVSEEVRDVASLTAENRSSMLQDVLRGAPTEIDYINCAVAKIGKSLGVPVPVNVKLCKLVRSSLRGRPYEDIDLSL